MNENNNGMIEYEKIGSRTLGGVTSAPTVPQNEHMSIPFMMSGPPSSIIAQSGPVSSTNSSGLPPSGHRPRSGSAREQAVHAVDYYNSNVLRARVGAGLSGPRSSVNERHLNSNNKPYVAGGLPSQKNNSRIYLNPDNLYRSNSSLELLHDHSNSTSEALPINGGNLRREYGSHGSIDVISSPSSATTSESFFAMLQDYRPAVLGVIGTDQRSPGPAEYLKGKVLESALKTNLGPNASSSQINSEDQNQGDRPSSPKLRAKFQKLWTPSNSDNRRQTNRIQTILIDDCSVPPSQTTSLLVGVSPINNSIVPNHSQIMSSPDIEERQRRRAFAHYDCQSLTANLGYAAKLRGLLLARRRNTTTGASAASLMGTRSSTPDAESGDEDNGDGQSNDLLESCPFFRNEIGNEEEREVCLTRALPSKATGQRRAVHRPALACGVSILECPINETLWKQTTCPFQKSQRPIESVDHGARYYRQYFQSQEHHNWFGMDEQLGPVAISIKREKLPELVDSSTHANRFQFRMIVRTSELLTLRGSVLEDSIPNTRGQGKPVTTKEVLEYVTPEIQINCLRLGVISPQCEQQLIKLDEQGLTNKYKIGILYCRAGQSSEEDMYNNEEAGPAFMEFLETIGKRVRLKGFEHYKAGLDNKTDSTGTHSLYANFQDCEIMFHVSTMLPFTPNNRQQLLRKRHIGNDIVTVVFQEPGALPFTPKNIRSQFQHVFIVVRAVNPCSDNTYYRVAVSRSKEVPVFGPPLTPGAKFPRGKAFAEFLLAKVINAENAAHRSEKFATMATRTRQEYLKDLATNYCTTTVVDTGPKFSIFPSKKKEKPKLRFSGDSIQRGAFCWQVVLQDSGQSTAVDCFLGISTETFVLIEECSRQIVFVTPCKSILGWSTNGNSLRIYHHQGECVTVNMRDSGERDEQLEVIERLRSVTVGCGARELNLRRNPMGQLGFHVQPDGVVTQVETSGQAWVAGLRQGFRLVEICKVAVATLSHDQMVDLLKTSAQVTVTVIESFADFSPRRGCLLPNCRFNSFAYENDYESSENSKNSKKSSANAQLQQPVVNHRRRYERNFSPPRSSNSSGYGTGSSSRSFSIPNEHGRQVVDMGTLTSSSSGHSSNDDRWYDVLENVELQTPNNQIQNPQHTHHNHNNEHSKLAPSASLPITNNGNPRPLSIHDPTKLSTALSEHFVKSNNLESLGSKHSSRKSEHNELNLIANEQIYNKSIGSTDDELQTDFSPQLKRSATTTSIPKIISANSGNISSSSSSSRNNSPRPLSEALSASAAAKLRPGVTPRNQAFLLQRNSTTGNTLQEDLMKLINPDSDEIFAQCNGTKTLKNLKTDEIILKNKSRSREGINIPQQNVADLRKSGGTKGTEGEKPEVIYTTARPATVVTQNKNNESNNTALDNLLFISEAGRYQPNGSASTSRKFDGQMASQPLPLLPDTNDMDWSSLVDTATKAMMMQFTEESKHIAANQDNVPLNLHHSSMDLQQSQHEPQSLNIQNTTSLSQYPLTPSNSLPELQTHLSQLEDRILRETRRRKSLEHAVRRLTEENRRLQDESQAAVQQLRRFTEWFFQTIDRQS